jgi:hypothetical protein
VLTRNTVVMTSMIPWDQKNAWMPVWARPRISA